VQGRVGCLSIIAPVLPGSTRSLALFAAARNLSLRALTSFVARAIFGGPSWPGELLAIEAHVAGGVVIDFPHIPNVLGHNQLAYRLIVPQVIDNPVVASRCASMTHMGQSTARHRRGGPTARLSGRRVEQAPWPNSGRQERRRRHGHDRHQYRRQGRSRCLYDQSQRSRAVLQ
jgi:hypothetical protein